MLGSRFIAERAFLYFRYPRGVKNIKRDIYVPILENPEIIESQKPNLASYDIVGRPGNVFAYLGSKSREFVITFKITLPHVRQYIDAVGLNKFFWTNNKLNYHSVAKNKFSLLGQDKEGKLNEQKVTRPTELEPLGGPGDLDLINIDRYVPQDNLAFENKFFGNLSNGKLDKDSVNLLVYWCNVIRTSVIGNYKDVALGPPTVYLNYGTLYNNIPCVCTNFNIRIKDMPAGYDLLTLTPRQVEIVMNLAENRTSNKNYKPFSFIEGNGVTGWESVIEKGTMDPYNGLYDQKTAAVGANLAADAALGLFSLGSQKRDLTGWTDVTWRDPNNFA